MSPMISRSFLITPTDADSLRTAAGREGCTAAEFIRRAVAARVAGTTSTTGPSLSTTAQLQAATAALLAAAENTERLKTQVDRINTVGRQFAEIATRMEAKQS